MTAQLGEDLRKVAHIARIHHRDFQEADFGIDFQ